MKEVDNILEVKDLAVSFQTFFGEVEAVRDISFNVRRASTLAIVGESGSGKSVTANSIIKLLPDSAVYKNGYIKFNGEDLVKTKEKDMEELRGNKISMVFQDPMTSLNPTMKVGKQISEGVKAHKNISNEEATKLAIDMLDLVAVPQPEQRVKQYPHEFSGGMRQRVMIALAMASKPELLIADEPTTALDVTVQAQILDLMKGLKDDFNTSIILITHDLGVVADMADEILVMYAGQILEQGTVDDIFANPKHPYTIQLMNAVPRLDMDKNEVLHSIEGSPPDLYMPPKGCSFYDRCNQAMKICENHMPGFTDFGNGHCSRCWLNDPQCNREEDKNND